MRFYKLLLSIFCLVLISVSCVDEDSFVIKVKPEDQVFGPFVTVELHSLSFNADDFANATVEVTFDAPSKNVQSYSFRVKDTFLGDDLSDYVDVATVTSFPTTVTLKAADIAADMGITDFSHFIGHQFVFDGVSTGIDGTIGKYDLLDEDLKVSKGQKQAYRFSVFVLCPSDIPTEGTWTGVGEWSYNGIVMTNDNVTLTSLDNAFYQLSDGSGALYSMFGFDLNHPFEIMDLCGSILITGEDSGFTIIQDPDRLGTWDPATQTLTIYWYDSGNGITGKTTLTRN